VKSMETTVYGKWIMIGEHAAVRGKPALVFPLLARSLHLRYLDNGQPLSVEFEGTHGEEMRLLFWGVIEKAFEMTGHSRRESTGQFVLSSTIPVGAGLGASATLCVAIGRWFSEKGWVQESELLEFCRQLENLFHGESSGLDVAVALYAKGLHYERGGDIHPIQPLWSPKWYISYSGKRGVTSECIARVRELWAKDSALGEKIDLDMHEAVLAAERALLTEYSEKAFDELADAIHKARSCFEHWGLAGGEMGQHLQWLIDQGAYAVKPTGSGGGGYALSLWRREPPAEALVSLVPLSVLEK
jgi:mevalonate kinase